ncbi:MAG TPA: polyketide synthase dehydratase domain-containing protein, partial [Solirubrobacterales bacterium]|nr:polyketide synthase dehydratase domain-containing protein [Solirubrobacterales bacterium]
VAKSLSFSEPQIPIVSNLTGEQLTNEQATDPAYWVSQVRQAVRFAGAVTTLDAQGATTYLELGPDAVLTAMASECLEDAERQPALIPTLRRDRPEVQTLALSLAAAHAAGARLDWVTFFDGTGVKRVPLPTYPFQRRHYWLSVAADAGDPSAIGLADAEHPLLAATIETPEGEGLSFTGRLSLATHPWLADHAVGGTVLLPGTAFVELALKAGEQVEAPTLEELTLQAPLILSEQGAVALQVSIGGPDEEGRREVSIHSRPDGAEGGWSSHAQGLLSPQAPQAHEPLAEWPPSGATEIDVEGLYDQLGAYGLEYGAAFQGLTKAWQDGKAVYAELSLADAQREDVQRFGIHPALLDSALHGIGFLPDSGSGSGEGVKLPFAWGDVSLHAVGATELRVRIEGKGEAASLTLADPSGTVVVAVGSLRLRPLDLSQLQGAGGARDELLGLRWVEVSGEGEPSSGDGPTRLASIGGLDLPGVERHRDVEALCAGLGDGEEAPELVLWEPAPGRSQGLPEAARATTQDALELLQEWLSEESLTGSRLVVVTRGAVAATEGEAPDLALAPLWGLLRCAQAENPDRFALVDTDGSEASLAALSAALGLEEETQLALREGQLLAPRAVPMPAPPQEDGEPARVFDPDSTVLVTGATGALGGLVARHLAAEHGARHLLLVSRRGEE